MVGDPKVGKRSLVTNYVEDEFYDCGFEKISKNSILQSLVEIYVNIPTHILGIISQMSFIQSTFLIFVYT